MKITEDYSSLFLTCYYESIREKKLVEKASIHLQNTAQRFEDENALMSSCFFNLEDDIVNHEAHAARMHLIKNAAAIDRIVALSDISKKETATREEEDLDVLDTLIETQELLQQTVHTYSHSFPRPVMSSTARIVVYFYYFTGHLFVHVQSTVLSAVY